MVREIISLQVGQAGNQIGAGVWEEIAREHCLNADGTFDHKNERLKDHDNDGEWEQLEGIGVYFRTVGEDALKAKYVPRAVIVDLEPSTIDVIKASEYGKMYRPDCMVFGSNGAGNNWAKGHYTEGAEVIDEVLDIARRETESSDCVQGFKFFHSLGGGTGSGMGTLLTLKIRDAYPDKIGCSVSVFPSPKVSDTVVEPYNAILSSHQLLENCDESIMVDNEALHNIAQNSLKQNNPTYATLNSLVSQAVCGITASLRFPGKLNGDLRKMGVNLIPFPRLHFFLVSQAPLLAASVRSHTKMTIKELTNQAFDSKNFYSNIKPGNGKYLACSLVYRGEDLESSAIDEAVCRLNNSSLAEFVEWIPNNVKSGIVDVPPVNAKMSATFTANTTANKDIFSRLVKQFTTMFKRKAFIHWYTDEGMDEMEFNESVDNIKDLISEYQEKESVVMNLDAHDAEDEE